MTIYALLVAVSEYPDPISDLPGCEADVAAIAAFFREYARLNEVDFSPVTLLNETADRAGVIDGFQHFAAAGPDDICLFYFSGHGAQMPAPPEFWDEETDRKCETVVLHDSRKHGGRDLADKEISYLLATHAKAAGQVLVLADSCHSGTISRMATARPRTTANNNTPVSYEDFLGSATYARSGQFRHPPQTDHVTLSACHPEQLAMEMPMQGVPHGLFTWYLIETMNGCNLAEMSYAELIDRVRVRVKNRYRRQDVQAGTVGNADLNQRFLGGKLKRNRSFVLHHDQRFGWYIERGQVNGVRANAGGMILDGATERPVTVGEADAGRCFVNPEAWMDPASAPYPLLSLETVSNPLPVYLDPSLGAVQITTLANEIAREEATLVRTENPAEATYHLTLLPDYGISMVLPGETRPLFKSQKRQSPNWGPDFVEKLSKVSTYEQALQLAPANQSLVLDDLVEIKLEQVFLRGRTETGAPEEKATDGTAVFAYTATDTGKLRNPKLRLSVRRKRTTGGSLFVGLLAFDESFGVSTQPMPVKELTPGDTEPYTTHLPAEDKHGQVFNFTFIDLMLPDALQDWGITEINNYFKVVISETNFNLDQYQQDGLEIQEKLDGNRKRAFGSVVLDDDDPDEGPRWGVKTIPVTIFRPLMNERGTKHFGQTGAPVSIAKKPAGFTVGDIMLDASLSSTRSLTSGGTPPCPTQGFLLEPISLVSSRSSRSEETPLDMLQLFDVQNGAAVTEASPLHLKAPDPARMGALIFAFDEEAQRYYPVGFPDKESGMMVVTQLPPARPEAYTRSLGGSVKLFFRKVVSDYVPWLDGDVNQLRKAEISAEMTLNYVTASAGIIREAVAGAEVIAVFIHGIIGDTTTAPLLLRRAKMPDGSPVYDQYDLLLTFDYENLHTSLMQTAQDLQQKLMEAGLGPGHGKILHVYSHSMGGLVSRCFIEILRGKEVVSHLLQFGTPNGGSPYGNVAQWVTPLLARALAGGAAYAPYLAPLLGLRWFINNALETLKEMKIGSEFTKMLKEKGERGDVPYSLINGDIRLLPDVSAADVSFFKRIVAKLDWQDLADSTLFQQPTDVAVSVASQQDIPGITGLHEAIGSDHMSYFMTKAAIEVFEGYLPRLFPKLFVDQSGGNLSGLKTL